MTESEQGGGVVSKRTGRRERGRRRFSGAAPASGGAPTSGDPAQHDLGVVLIHGIGGQTPRHTLDAWAPPIESALEGVLADHGRDVSSAGRPHLQGARGPLPARHTDVGSQGRTLERVLITEAHWADAYRGRRLLGTLPWLARIGPAMVLPFMPDGRDRMSETPTGHEVAQAEVRLLMRFAGIFFVLVFLASIPRPVLWAVIGVGLSVVALMMLDPRFNLAGHVRMAAAEEDGLKAVQQRIEEVIEATRAVSSKVVVVAHSQGGYLAHRTLAAMAPSDITLITVGSGLRPITALRVMGSQRRFSVGSWVALLGVMSGEVWLLTHLRPSEVFSPFVLAGIDVRQLVMSLVVGAGTQGVATNDVSPGVWEVVRGVLPTVELDWWLPLAAIPYLAACVVIRRSGPDFVREVTIGGLSRTDWVDVTSHQDLVGRLIFPALPHGVEEKPVVVTGNAVMDHVRYFSHRGITPWVIAAQLSRLLGYSSDSRVEAARESALARSARRHDFRSAVLLVPLIPIALLAVVLERDPWFAVLSAIPLLIWTLVPTSLGVWLLDGWDSWQVSRFLAGRRAPLLTPGVSHRWPEACALAATAVLAALSGTAVTAWLDFLQVDVGDGLAAVHHVWAVAALVLAVIVAAGYRPPSLGVTAALVFVTVIVGVPSWQALTAFYPPWLPPLGLASLVLVAVSTASALAGFNRVTSLLVRGAKALRCKGRTGRG